MDWVLAMDGGNSVIRIAGIREGEVLALGRLPTGVLDPEEKLGHMVEALSSRLGKAPVGVGVSTVVPAQAPAMEAAAARTGAPITRVGPETAAGMTIAYQPPESLGPDRIANTVAARRAFGTPCIAVDLGTALTIDVVDAAGVFRGGLIFPGVSAASGALDRATEQVRSAPATPTPTTVIGGSTQECVANGLGYGYAALIEGLLRKVRDELGEEAPAILTGGGRRWLAKRPAGIEVGDPHLTLRGVAILALSGDSPIAG